MDTESTRRPRTEPLLVTLAIIAPSVVPAGASLGGTPPGAASWLAGGAVQSLSQFALLIVIIGASGRLREYGVGRPRAADALKAMPLFAAVLILSRVATMMAAATGWAAGGAPGVAAIAIPSITGMSPAAVAALTALFSIAVAYREELFYRLYVIGSLRERGAGTIAAILVSTTLFAAGHAYQGLPGILSSLLVGAAMAAAATGGFGLHALSAAHAAYDFCVLSAAFGLFGG
ncbi:MAG: hypothetical protein CVV47_11950 [Spirochaetae bacterium HGW-Spirochaetae-3]|jgi:membrane protease YdiL (CAAX protease family)|nr:MAG: hypothetical protein CVV47_11950 [Spirochaetae bacterium HGW-Spirochaetae-3]